ncbi:MAG: hypothetical protein M0Z76_01670 [Gammaproteobacteria bacterium]|nr:hypothetical protein [Gammaproteobacteria bacterium]
MSDRLYRLLVGATLLVALFFQWHNVVLGLIAMLTLEGLSSARLPWLVTCARTKLFGRTSCPQFTTGTGARSRFQFEAERAWRLMAAVMLVVGIVNYHDIFWFLPWFLGFGMLGAGLSGVCPMLITARWLGFR